MSGTRRAQTGATQCPVDGDRVWRDLEALSAFQDDGKPLYTRRAFGHAYEDARRWLAGCMTEAGLAVRRDAGGNLVGVLRSGHRDAKAPSIVIGSHTDTVEGGGRFDGTLGVLGGLEVARALSKAGTQLIHDLEIVDFLAEEPTEYAVSTVGSRAWVGTLSREHLARRNPQGETLAEALRRNCVDPDAVSSARRTPGEIAAYLELHIEQGPLLEYQGLDVGVVTGIVSIRRLKVVVDGVAAHAGTTPMNLRRDALTGAAEFVLDVEQVACDSAGTVVATVGKIHVQPNASNVVPGRVECIIELRSLSGEDLDMVECRLRSMTDEKSSSRNLKITITEISVVPPAIADRRVVAALERGSAASGASSIRVASWAGHDASQVASIAPFGMLFAPSKSGVSHHPDEWTAPMQVTAAVKALYHGLLEVDKTIALRA
jgi:beta-ureidopropionase / N-carbamoyl-L-amino-acid hydrolase